MNDPRELKIQYGDYKGKAACDIADDKSITDFAQFLRVPKNYWPIGFNFSILDSSHKLEPKAFVSIYTVDIADYGSGIDNVNKRCQSKGETLLVYKFSKKISLTKLFSFFKRFYVNAFNKSMKAKNIEVIER